MSKFKIGEKVLLMQNGMYAGQSGYVRARNVIHKDKRTTVEYLVDFGGTMSDWKVLGKSSLSKCDETSNVRKPVVEEFDVKDGKKLVFVGVVEPKAYWFEDPNDWMNDIKKKGKVLSIGYSIYNGKDEYDSNIGIKFAKHRAKHNPFAKMESTFSGEFNDSTVKAIISAKKDYIVEHWDEFYRPRN